MARTEERQGVREREPGAVTIQCRPRDDLHPYRAARGEESAILATGAFVRLPPYFSLPFPLACLL